MTTDLKYARAACLVVQPWKGHRVYRPRDEEEEERAKARGEDCGLFQGRELDRVSLWTGYNLEETEAIEVTDCLVVGRRDLPTAASSAPIPRQPR